MKKLKYPKETLFKSLRLKYKLTQVAMAEKLNISQPAYCQLETGASWPSFEVIESTMELWNVPFKRFREYYTERKGILKGLAAQ